jgi:hypothetical protein
MFEAIKPLLDSGILNEETRVAIQEAWNSKLIEAREQIRTEIREEMAQRYAHDKANMVEALDRMVNDTLSTEIKKIAEERDAMAQDRVNYNQKMVAKLAGFEGFIKEALVAEMREFRADRSKYQDAVTKLQGFVAESLKKEITEFAEDKADLARAKVAVITEGKAKLEALRNEFIKKSANLVEQTVASTLRSELKQLKTDIQEAKENNFGRRIFEAFATEFTATHLNERAEVKKLMNALTMMETQLTEARASAESAMITAAAKDDQIRTINESIVRKEKMNQLLKPLAKEKAEVMRQLLESVPTDRLDVAFKKYLSPVMEGKATPKTTLVEAKKEVTGDRTAAAQIEQKSNIVEIRRLAGLVNN